MATPWVDFQNIKANVTIPELLQRFGIADQFREKNGALVGACPLPQHVHNPVKPNENQFRIDCRKGLWLYKCFSPDCADTPLGGGDVITFAKAMLGLTDQHVRLWFAEEFGERLNQQCPKRKRAGPKPTEEAREVGQEPQRAKVKAVDNKVADDAPPLKPLSFRLNLDSDMPYLRERGIADSTIRRFGLGLCSRGILKGYCAIPVYRYPRAAGENPVAYLGRWPGEDFDEEAGRPRYKWPGDFEKTRVLYGLQEALEVTGEDDPLIVVEGCFSVYHLVQNGFPVTVASFGASLSDKQAGLLIGTRRPIVILYDGNAAGSNGTKSAVGKLVEQTFVRSVRLPDGVAPDDLSEQELRSFLAR